MPKFARNLAFGTLVAGAVGYVAGILTAPKSGKETRSYLDKVRSSSIVEGEKRLKKLHTELSNLLSEVDKSSWTGKAADKLEALEGEVVGKANRTRQKIREMLTAAHDGSADDEDLERAINEAAKAIKSVRKYIKK
jgi:gas vesicle protein